MFGLCFRGSFTTIYVCCISSSVAFLLISILLPESPLWLMKKGYEDRALKTIEQIRGSNYPAQVEAKELHACVNAQNSRGTFYTKMAKYAFSRPFLQPLSMMLFLATVQGLCGVDAISQYCVVIFKMANIAVDEYVMAIFMQLGYTAGYILIAPFVDSFGRKRLFTTASWIMTISLVVLGATINPDADSMMSSPAGMCINGICFIRYVELSKVYM